MAVRGKEITPDSAYLGKKNNDRCVLLFGKDRNHLIDFLDCEQSYSNV